MGSAAAPCCTKTRWIDTLELAQKRFPGMSNSLDALCKRFKISLADRDMHGALIDARLLAEVYLELRGGKERGLDLTSRRRCAATPSRPHGDAQAYGETATAAAPRSDRRRRARRSR